MGLVTPIDVFEAIAGDFPDEDETPDIIAAGDHSWVVDGATDLHHLEQALDTSGLVTDEDDFSTVAGYLLRQFGRLPDVGDRHIFDDHAGRLSFDVLEIDARRIAKVKIHREPVDDAAPGETPQAA